MSYLLKIFTFLFFIFILSSIVLNATVIEISQTEFSLLKGRALTLLDGIPLEDFNLCLNTAKDLLPHDEEGLLFLSMCYQKVGDLHDAITCLEKMPPDSKHYLLAQIDLAKLYTETDNHKKATACYEKITKITPDNKNAGIELGMRYLESGQFNKANKLFSKLKKKFPESLEIQHMYDISKNKKGHNKPSSIILDVGYNYSNSKPGFMLLMDDGFDYEMNSLKTKITVPVSNSTSIKGSHISNDIADSYVENFTSTETGLEISHKLNRQTLLAGKVNFLTLPYEQNEIEGKLKYRKVDKKTVVGFDVGRLTYSADSNSFKSPANFLQCSGTFGIESSKELYIEVIPGLEYYSDDENLKSELMLSLSYFPENSPRLSIDALYKIFTFTKTYKENGDNLVYFSPEYGSDMYLGMMYKLNFSKASSLSLGGSLKRTEYEVQDSITEYYTIGCSVSAQMKITRNIALNMGYNFSISQSDGFPASQDMNANLRIAF
ncbi:tetratricopeptide repeat protein [bacterium]|nr:tetratricopeptide repeat protein [bacterium]